MRPLVLAFVCSAIPGVAVAQVTHAPHGELTAKARAEWVLHGNIGLQSLAVGVFTDGFDTAVDTPPEWHRDWSGFGKRYADREAFLAVENSIEAGLGAAFDEDPRYFRAGGRGFKTRLTYAVRRAFTTDRDGHEAPAWARYTSTVGGAYIQNAWLPPSQKTAGAMAWRFGNDYLGRVASNLFVEFWPDVRKRFGW